MRQSVRRYGLPSRTRGARLPLVRESSTVPRSPARPPEQWLLKRDAPSEAPISGPLPILSGSVIAVYEAKVGTVPTMWTGVRPRDRRGNCARKQANDRAGHGIREARAEPGCVGPSHMPYGPRAETCGDRGGRSRRTGRAGGRPRSGVGARGTVTPGVGRALPDSARGGAVFTRISAVGDQHPWGSVNIRASLRASVF